MYDETITGDGIRILYLSSSASPPPLNVLQEINEKESDAEQERKGKAILFVNSHGRSEIGTQ